jgi:hypothetical protein
VRDFMAVTRPNLSSANGVTITRIRTDTTTIPNPAAGPLALQANFGENLPGGPLDSLMFRITSTGGAGLTGGDFTTLISNVSINLNGERVFQFNAGVNTTAVDNAIGQLGYLLNSMGGSFAEQTGLAAGTRDAYLRIPIGQVMPNGVSRVEVTWGYAAPAAANGTGTFEMFALYNTNMQTSTFVPVSTTQAAMPAGQSQVVVRIPQKTGFVVSGIMVLDNQAALTTYGANGIVNTSQGPYGLQRNLISFIAGDLSGGVALPTTVTSLGPSGGAPASQPSVYLPSINCPGALFIPTFGLASDSDVTLLVDTQAAAAAAGMNRIFVPILTASVNANLPTQPRQTEAARSNTQKAILDRVDV